MIDRLIHAARALACTFGIGLGSVMLASCGGDTGSGGDVRGGAGATVEVQAVDNRFEAGEIRVKTGTEVVWINGGRNNHDVVPVEGDEWGIALADFLPKTAYSHVFDEPGTYEYYCSVHGTKNAGMKGTIVVEE